MPKLGTRQEFARELERLERQMARAYGTSVQRVRETVTIRVIRDAVGRADIRQIEDVLLTRAAMADVLEQLRDAFIAGGRQVQEAAPSRIEGPDGARVVFRFDVLDDTAQAWLAERSSRLVTQVREEQREAIRRVVEAGARQGRNPRLVALDIVGRLNPTTRRREGGIVGLTGQQAGWVLNARAELSDPELMGNYLRRKRRDRRFDAMVRRARREGRALTASQINRIVNRYSQRLLAYRGETIARTEMLQGFSTGRHQAIDQLVDQAGVGAEFVTRVWDATLDARTRSDHRQMNGQRVIGREQPFEAPDGSLLMHPGDTSLGASGAQVINCRCYEDIVVDFVGAEAARNG